MTRPVEELFEPYARAKVERPRCIHQLDESDMDHLFAESSSATFGAPFELLVWKSRQHAKKVLPGLGEPPLDLSPVGRGERFSVRPDQGLGVFVRLDERLDFFGYDDRYL